MAVATYNFIWQEGDDGTISMVLKDDNGTGINLTGFKLRMDVRGPLNTILFTFNSDDISEVPSVDNPGASDNEAVLGSDGSINIVVPRSVSLPGGAFATNIGIAMNYDIFLRDTNNKQRKILQGTITIQPSSTKWT